MAEYCSPTIYYRTLYDLARLVGNIGDLNLLRLKHITINLFFICTNSIHYFQVKLEFPPNSPNLPAIVLFFFIGRI